MFSPMCTHPNVLLSISDTAPGVREPEGQGVTPKIYLGVKQGTLTPWIYWKEIFSGAQVS